MVWYVVSLSQYPQIPEDYCVCPRAGKKQPGGQYRDEVKGQDVFRGQVIQLYGERQGWCPMDCLEFGLELQVADPTQGIAV